MILLFGLLQLLVGQPPLTCAQWDPSWGDPGFFCIDLLPRELDGELSGRVRILPAPSPFGISVDRNGILQSTLLIQLDTGSAEGPFTAWIAGPLLTPLERLGSVGPGETRFGPIGFEKYTIFITAGPHADSADMRLAVLRGMSPSNLLQPHGTNELPPRLVPEEAMHRMHEAGWEMPAPHPLVPDMPPGLEALMPDAEPWRAGAGVDLASLPPLRPRELRQVKSGDSLRLEAAMVRRQVGGKTFPAYAFNRQSPGPLIVAHKGDSITVTLVNRLDQPTTVHWHGLRQDYRFDGVPGMSQQPVSPGDSFAYSLVFPDDGIFWYHPHVREDIQQELGLYGNILVRGVDSASMGPVRREEVVMLDDLLLGDTGPLPFGADTATHALMGRFGNQFLVNGEPEWNLEVKTGEVVRLYLTNAANARTFNLSIDSADLTLQAAGLGPLGQPRTVESVVLAPAERWVVDARFTRPGRYAITNRARGLHPTARAFISVIDTVGWANVLVGSGEWEVASGKWGVGSGDARSGDFPSHFPLPTSHLKTLVLSLRTDSLAFGLRQALRLDTLWTPPAEMTGLMPMMDWIPTARGITWVLRDSTTGRENMDIDWRFKKGDRILLRLVNDRHVVHPMAHPIHLHGQRFMVVARNGEPTRPEDRAWKDTALVPAGGTVDLWIELDNPGHWMLHCHIAEHLGSGMHLGMHVDEN
ncbi:MAG TPA: multicopper oxidase family protein [Gemmatimonadales bacterium]|nr:multicopper oxidase family protein [Gemmatimonadales bacterium]